MTHRSTPAPVCSDYEETSTRPGAGTRRATVGVRDFNQNGVGPGPRKLAHFRAALWARGTPPLYAQEGKGDHAVVHVKLFDPCGSASWYLLEWDEALDAAFGYITGLEDDEFGYVALDELALLRGALGLGIELDTGFLPTALGPVLKGPKSRS